MSLATLLAGKTAAQLLEVYLVKLQLEAGKPGRTFDISELDTSGSPSGTLVRLDMEALADLYAYVPTVAGAGFLLYASGAWLDNVALNVYDETRKPSLFTIGWVSLTADAGFGAYTLQAGDVRVSDGTNVAFISLEPAVIPQGGTVDVLMIAEHPGSAYNLPSGALTRLLTPFPGVSATNPTDWITRTATRAQAGVDAESDDQLRARCQAKWGALATGSPRDAYIYWALTAGAAVTRVRVRDDLPRGEGTVDVVLAGDGALSPGQVAQVDAYIQARRPVTASVQVYAATPITVSIAGTVQIPAALLSQAQAEGARNLAQLQRTLPIGGKVTRAALIEALFAPSFGFGYQAGQLSQINVILTTPAADVQLGIAEVAALDTGSIAYVGI